MAVFKENSGLFCNDNIPGISHSLHTCTSATSCQLMLHRDRVHGRSPLSILGGHPRGMHRNPQIQMQLIPSHPFLQPCPSDTAELTALLPPKGSHQGIPRAQSSPPCRHPQESDARPSGHKSTAQNPSPGSPLLPAPPLVPMETSPQNSCVGDREMLALPSPGAEHPGHTHSLGILGLDQILCIRMAESSEIVS